MRIEGKLLTASGGPAMPYIRREMKKLKAELVGIQVRLPIELNALGKRAGALMAERVRRMTKRQKSTGRLAAALETCMKFSKYRTGYQVSMSTGSLPEYWAMINYGGFVSPETLTGFWSDNKGRSNAKLAGGKGKGTFYAAGNGYLMTPASPIKGFHYISYAYRRIIAEMRSGKFTRKVVRKVR